MLIPTTVPGYFTPHVNTRAVQHVDADGAVTIQIEEVVLDDYPYLATDFSISALLAAGMDPTMFRTATSFNTKIQGASVVSDVESLIDSLPATPDVNPFNVI